MALHCHTKIALALPLIMHARRPCANYTQASKRKVLWGADILTISYLVPQIEFQWLRLAVSPLSARLSSLAACLSEPAYVFDDGRGFRFEKLRCVLLIDVPKRWWFVVAVEQGRLGVELWDSVCRIADCSLQLPCLWCEHGETALSAWFEHHLIRHTIALCGLLAIELYQGEVDIVAVKQTLAWHYKMI